MTKFFRQLREFLVSRVNDVKKFKEVELVFLTSIVFHGFALSVMLWGSLNYDIRYFALLIHVVIWAVGFSAFGCSVYVRYFVGEMERQKRLRFRYIDLYIWMIPLELMFIGVAFTQGYAFGGGMILSYVVGYCVNPLPVFRSKSLGVFLLRKYRHGDPLKESVKPKNACPNAEKK